MMLRSIIIALCAMLLALAGGMAYGATFGNTSNLAGSATIEGTIRGQIFTMPEDGIATSMTTFITTTTAAKLVRMIIYKASDTSFVATTEMRIIPTGTDVEETFNFNYTVNLTGGVDYLLCAWGQEGAGAMSISVNLLAGTGDSRVDLEGFTSFPPNPTVPTGHNASENSIYCTYTAGAQLTLGNTAIQSATADIKSRPNGGVFTTPATSISVSSVTPHVALQSAAGEEDTIQCAIYKKSDLSLVDTTYQIKFDGDTAVGGAIRLWREFTFPSAVTLAASTQYIFEVYSGQFSSSATVRASASGGEGHYTDLDETFPTWPATLSNISDADGLVSVFADYTVVTTGVKPRRRKIILGQPMGLVQEATETFAGSVDAFTR